MWIRSERWMSKTVHNDNKNDHWKVISDPCRASKKEGEAFG